MTEGSKFAENKPAAKPEKFGSLNDLNLPPRLPQSREELDLTITLLGNRKHCELSSAARRRLENLIGVYPTVKEAALWKRILRRVCGETIEGEFKVKR